MESKNLIPAIADLFDLDRSRAALLLVDYVYPWNLIPKIPGIIQTLIQKLDPDEFYSPSKGVWISRSAIVADNVTILGPAIIDHGASILHVSYIRENVLVGKNSTIANATELKNVILFDEVTLPHFNYAGDSILGYRSHFGAGAITSNLRSDKRNISVKIGDKIYETGLRKFGALIGDYVEIGSNTVLNPGTIIGRESLIYPLSLVRGYVPPKMIFKNNGEVVKRNDQT